MSTLTLGAIHVYPVKSAAGIDCDAWTVEPRGLCHDRRWVLVDGSGVTLTARELPVLTRVRTRLSSESLHLTSPLDGTELTLEAPPAGPLDARAWIWGDPVDAHDCGDDASRWFADIVDRPVRLLAMTADSRRDADTAYARPGDEVSFADGFPLLLIGAASLTDIDDRCPGYGSARRFRPNLVVTGAAPYAEDSWRRVRIGDIEFEGVKNCERCEVPSIDPDTGTPDARREPMRTLSTYRRRPGGVFLGQNLIPRGRGTLRVGEAVVVSG